MSNQSLKTLIEKKAQIEEEILKRYKKTIPKETVKSLYKLYISINNPPEIGVTINLPVQCCASINPIHGIVTIRESGFSPTNYTLLNHVKNNPKVIKLFENWQLKKKEYSELFNEICKKYNVRKSDLKLIVEQRLEEDLMTWGQPGIS